jgi:alcohol dehydrogenase class IV
MMNTKSFVYIQRNRKMVFGAGSRNSLAIEISALGAQRVFLILDAGALNIQSSIEQLIGTSLVATWTDVQQHVPIELAESARAAVSTAGADAVVCVGGGSSTGLAKAIALSHQLPIVAIPTTYAGSEQTTIYGLTGGRHKQTGSDPIVLPRVVLYDAELTLQLPTNVTGASAFNALAHSVEALYAPGCNPVTTAIALQGVRAINESLPLVMASPNNVEARSQLLYGAAMSGIALGDTAPAFHHKICHVLGGTFGLVHADAHSVVLPHAIAFNAPAIPKEISQLANALDCRADDVAGNLWDLAKRSGVPTSLAQLGLRREDLGEVATRAAAEISTNPRSFDAAAIELLLQGAFDGVRPPATTS